MVEIRLDFYLSDELNDEFMINVIFVDSFQSEQEARFNVSKFPVKCTL